MGWLTWEIIASLHPVSTTGPVEEMFAMDWQVVSLNTAEDWGRNYLINCFLVKKCQFVEAKSFHRNPLASFKLGSGRSLRGWEGKS